MIVAKSVHNINQKIYTKKKKKSLHQECHLIPIMPLRVIHDYAHNIAS